MNYLDYATWPAYPIVEFVRESGLTAEAFTNPWFIGAYAVATAAIMIAAVVVTVKTPKNEELCYGEW